MTTKKQPRKHIRKGAIGLAVISLISVSILSAFGFFQPGDIIPDYSSNAPYPGDWAFYGQDPLGDGPAELFVSASGMAASMLLDGETIILSRLPYEEVALYQSSVRPWHVPNGGGGSVWFEINADTPELISGVIHVNYNSGSSENFNFNMDLVDIDLSMIDNPYNVPEGGWEMDIDNGQDNCGENGGDAGFESFSGMESGEIQVEYVYDFDNGGGDTNEIYIHDGTDGFFMERTGDNSYSHIGDGLDMGLPVDSNGDLLLDYQDDTFTGQFEFNVNAEGQMQGFLNVSSSSGCNANFTVNLNHTSPPAPPAVS